jgi:hypothetical protein
LLVNAAPAQDGSVVPIDEYVDHILDRKYETRAAIETISFDAVQYRRNMDSDWQVKSEELWRKRVFLRGRTQRHEVVLGVTEGETVWDDQKILDEIENLIDNYGEDSERKDFKGPLDTMFVSDYEFVYAGRENSMGIVLDRVEFTSKVSDDKHIGGYMLIDPDDYSLMSMEFELADRPIGVRMMRIAYDFDRLENGFTYPVRTSFKGYFGILLFNARREMVEEYSNFEINPELPDSLFETPYSYQPEN